MELRNKKYLGCVREAVECGINILFDCNVGIIRSLGEIVSYCDSVNTNLEPLG